MRSEKTEEIGVMNRSTFASRRTSAQLTFCCCCFSLCFLSGLGDRPSNATTTAYKSSSPSTGVEFLLVVLGLVTTVAFSCFLFKLWQKKKRQEEQARFLKLFEDDDDLEVELGIRD